ncbi:hypothetical protein MMAD_53440 [Mycolicibacterium madagascariense]|uniref:ESX-1 secretion-associated protein EspK n=3 Tax=Mycolicibacterium madagascariense TaxID=212765 RepID=A0A7I7XP80_9MYCO|nr:hypothetical protein MMAD_53440 [Mycolicibacterium madagascariense]
MIYDLCRGADSEIERVASDGTYSQTQRDRQISLIIDRVQKENSAVVSAVGEAIENEHLYPAAGSGVNEKSQSKVLRRVLGPETRISTESRSGVSPKVAELGGPTQPVCARSVATSARGATKQLVADRGANPLSPEVASAVTLHGRDSESFPRDELQYAPPPTPTPAPPTPTPTAINTSPTTTPVPPSTTLTSKPIAIELKSTPMAATAGGGLERAPVEQFAKNFASAPPTAPTSTTSTTATNAPTAPPPPAPSMPTDTAATASARHQSVTAASSAPSVVGGPPASTSQPPPPLNPPMPLTPPPAVPPVAGVGPPPATVTGAGVLAAGKPDATTGLAPVPVSAVRRQRDAALSAAMPAGLRRSDHPGAALIRARRIAAALNMGAPVYGFFWATGVTADGSIVVANSYGVGYIPDDVELPPHVTMASADESIAPTERGTWATYPIRALQGWARAHEQRLTAVIATVEQFAGVDPGVRTIAIEPTDIPETGRLTGRSRLEVLAPEVAERLSATADAALSHLLPPAPVDQSAPADRSAALWFELAKPLMSTASTRGVTHLTAFVAYAAHAQEHALHAAYRAVEPSAQRAAIADWIYWQHVGVLTSEAIGG